MFLLILLYQTAPVFTFFSQIHTMKYTKRMFEVIILDSYRNYGCGRGRNMNPRGTNGSYPYSGSSRCVMPADTTCRKSSMPDCGCGNKTVMPDCGCKEMQMKSDCGCGEMSMKSDCSCASVSRRSNCDCGDKNEHMRHMPVGIGYVPMQKWEEMYDPATALCQGTSFPCLNLIFCGKRG